MDGLEKCFFALKVVYDYKDPRDVYRLEYFDFKRLNAVHRAFRPHKIDRVLFFPLKL